MAFIPNLSTVYTLDGGYYVVVAKGNSNNAQRASMQDFAVYIAQAINANGMETQYSAPSANAFNAEIAASTANIVWLILTPTAGFSAGTITLPSAPVDQQQVSINCTQAVTTLTVAGNGATVTGAPTTLAANAFFSMRYDETLSTWYRVG